MVLTALRDPVADAAPPDPLQQAARRAEAARQHSLGRLSQKHGLIAEALDAYGLALQLGGADPDRLADMSCALSDAGLFDAAAAAARIAIQMRPGCTVSHNNLAFALLNANRSVEAIGAYDAALRLDRGYVPARFGRALALLKAGRFGQGWTEYEWRRRRRGSTGNRPDLLMPEWTGGALKGRSILLHGEQGLGDVIQFSRFATTLAARGAHVVLEAPRCLVRLLQRIEGVARVVAAGDALPRTDLHCPVGSLPYRLRIDPERLPRTPYLPRPPAGPAARALRDRATRDAPGALVVGLVWAGDPRPQFLAANLIDRRRSTSLSALAPLFDVPGVRFLSFQLGEARAQIDACGLPVTDAMQGIGDFADTADILPAADLLISVDTSMVHLAGAMGFPVWMASRFDCCWRWGENRVDTPWYPSMRLFHQPAPGDWAGLVGTLKQQLQARVEQVALPAGC